MSDVPKVGEREQPILADWLGRLPKPVGVMACNDDRGREVLEVCRFAGIRVPEELAVIGLAGCCSSELLSSTV